MNINSIKNKRRLVPRWRAFDKASSTGELASNKKKQDIDISFDEDIHFTRSKERWDKEKNIENAAELLFHSITHSRESDAIEPAIFIVRNRDKTSGNLPILADKIANGKAGTGRHLNENQTENLLDLKSSIYVAIHDLKVKLHSWPNNAIYWVEIARLYTAIGQIEKADRAISTSLQLARKNRYVVRSAIRFYTHTRDFDKLTKLFKSHHSLYEDQWILSSYVALQDKLRKPQLKIKAVRNKIERLDDSDVTELVGALASLELEAGSIRAAKKHFERSALKPNDNSLAQLSWVRDKIGVVSTNREYNIPYIHEAKSRDYFMDGSYENSLSSTIDWMLDEPFSSIPATTGSYIASSFTDNLECAAQFCELGLLANPNDMMLLNNYTVVLARSGKVEEAYNQFKKIRIEEDNNVSKVTMLATYGLLLMRGGFIDDGRSSYQRSIELSKKINSKETSALAAINFALEELNLAKPDFELASKVFTQNEMQDGPNHIEFMQEKVKNRMLRRLQEPY